MPEEKQTVPPKPMRLAVFQFLQRLHERIDHRGCLDSHSGGELEADSDLRAAERVSHRLCVAVLLSPAGVRLFDPPSPGRADVFPQRVERDHRGAAAALYRSHPGLHHRLPRGAGQSIAQLRELGMHFTTTELLDKVDVSEIPHSVELAVYYLGIFIFAEAAFVLTAIREYLQDLLHLDELSLLHSQARTIDAPNEAQLPAAPESTRSPG
jgi:hypothetical protein